ncbi:MAG: ATPase [Bryobacteraceae bacterium]
MKTVLLAILLCAAASAEVVDKSTSGLLVRNTTIVQANPAKTYQAIVDGIGEWWVGSHTWSGNSKNLSIVAKAGGCFCEKWPEGEVQHMTVIFASPGKLLRMSGALGPMQEAGIAGTLTFELKASGAGTEIVLSYSAGGYFQGGIQNLAAPVDSVIAAQLDGLKKYLAK